MNVSRGRLDVFSRRLAFCLSLTCLFTACTRPEGTRPEVIRPVKTMVVVRGESERVRSFPGVAEASMTAELAFQVSGVLVDFPVKEGQKVAAGDLIGQLRPTEFEARLKALQSQLDQARANLQSLRAGQRPEEIMRLEAQLRAADAKLANAKIEYDRAARLLRSNSISRANHDLAQTAYRVAKEEQEAASQMLEKGAVAREEDIDAQEAVVRGLEAQVVEANLQLSDATLRAPYDGVIAQRFVDVNQNVAAKSPVVRFQDVQELVVAVDVPEAVMAGIRSSEITRSIAEFTGAPGLEFPVTLREMAQVADPATQTFKVRVVMKAPENVKLLPGMSATVTITYHRAGILGDRILVPIQAVVKEDAGKQTVWVIGPEGVVSRREVKIGEATGAEVEVLEGLEAGDRIAVAGASMLREGMKVRDLGDELGGGQ
ncbi:MAG: efflux RND transporter periplasmic adaptor subunit [Planctomycetota bacterium]